MEEAQRLYLLERAKVFFHENLIKKHVSEALDRASVLSNYNVNPFLYKYLAYFLKGNDDPRSIAEALIYPRILGSSITTSFGMNAQKLISFLFEGFGSGIPGIDIEFIDAIDNRKKYCQLKSGPNTINHDDVETIFGHFSSIKRISRGNYNNLSTNDLIVGVIYGEPAELSTHYLRINKEYPVYIGKEFWHRLTGAENFYAQLAEAIGQIALEIDGPQKLEQAIIKLELQIRAQMSF